MIEPRPPDAGAPGGDAALTREALKVETHLHTLHSDGQDEVRAMFEACRDAGYQAVALTDHNTTSGLPAARQAAESLGLLLLEGVEVTTFRGHVVALGVTHAPEWRDLERRGFNALARDVHTAGGLVCIAHPTRLGSPLCSGCAWEFSDVDPRLVDLWEVFSAPQPHSPHPETSLAAWRTLLAGGGKIAPAAAGDVHSVAAARAARSATYVYAAERSAAGVLRALRERRVFVSRGRRLDFWLHDEATGRTAAAGACVGLGDWSAHSAPEAHVEQVLTPSGTCAYAALYAPDGSLEAVSAPIWIETSQRAEARV